jgi:hypothetical protein
MGTNVGSLLSVSSNTILRSRKSKRDLHKTKKKQNLKRKKDSGKNRNRLRMIELKRKDKMLKIRHE